MPKLSALAVQAKKSGKEPAPKKTVKQQPTTSFLKSSEHVSQSDLESETESEDESTDEEEPAKPAQLVPPVVKANVTATNNASSSGDSGSDEESETSDEGSTDGSSGSGSESESDEGEENSKEDLPGNDADAAASSKKATTPESQSVPANPASVFEPPQGFEKLPPHQGGKPKAAELFSAANLAGKQVWYITAPASVPIDAIKKVSLKDVWAGKPAISHNGEDYGFVQNEVEDKRYSKILIPDDTGTAYRVAKKALDQTLHLQQIVHLPIASSSQGHARNSSKATVPAKKPIRQQPDGLKMHFHPIGDCHSSESEDDNAAFRRPISVGQSKPDPGNSASTSNDSSGPDQEMVDAPEFISKSRSSTKPSQESETSGSETSSSGSSSSDESDRNVVKPKKNAANPSQQASLKRKLGQMKDIDTPNSSFIPPNKQETPLKKTKIQKSSAKTAPGQYPLNKIQEATSPSILPPSSPPSKVSAKNTPIPPPRSLSKLPSSQITGQSIENAPEARKDKKTVKESPSGATSRSSQQTPTSKRGEDKHSTFEDRIAAIGPSFNAGAREKEIKRLKKNEASRLAKAKKRSSQIDASGEAVDRSSRDLSPGLGRQSSSTIKFSPAPAPGKASVKIGTPNLTTEKKPKKVRSIPVAASSSQPVPDETPSKKPSVIVPPPRKMTSILPPGTKGSASH